MTFHRLLSIPEAADALNVPAASLRSVADEHGLTIRMGRAVRLHPDDLETLVKLCRVAPSVRASISDGSPGKPPITKSETPDRTPYRPAQAAAERLKKPLRPTSNASTGQLVQLPRTS